MPFKSEAQRKWMWKNKPKMAKEWQKHTPKGKKLPEKVKESSLMLKLGALTEFTKTAKKKMPHFTEQNRPTKTKEIYSAIKRKPGEMRKRYGSNWKETAARIAGRQGKPGKQKQGPPYKGPINK